MAAPIEAMRDDAALLHEGARRRFEEAIAAMEGSDRRKIADLTYKLDELSAPFAQRRIERDLQLALKGRSADQVAENLEIAER